MSDRIFRLTSPHMTGKDIELGQADLLRKLEFWGVDLGEYPLRADGDYGVATRSAYRTVCYGLGIDGDELEGGVTPALRSKIRSAKLGPEELERHADRAAWRDRLVAKWDGGGVSSPLAKILDHRNGWTGSGGHDGTDLICPPEAVGHSICRARVARVDAAARSSAPVDDAWWGNNPQGSPGHPVSHGDGIVVLEALVTVGPIKKGMYIGYGHAEFARVKVGQIVAAGQPICRAGFARAWHFHFMVNAGGAKFRRGDGSPRGVGDRDPWPIVSYCIRNA